MSVSAIGKKVDRLESDSYEQVEKLRDVILGSVILFSFDGRNKGMYLFTHDRIEGSAVKQAIDFINAGHETRYPSYRRHESHTEWYSVDLSRSSMTSNERTPFLRALIDEQGYVAFEIERHEVTSYIFSYWDTESFPMTIFVYQDIADAIKDFDEIAKDLMVVEETNVEIKGTRDFRGVRRETFSEIEYYNLYQIGV